MINKRHACKKKSFSAKMASRLRELTGLVDILAKRPAELPSALGKLLRHFVRNIRDLRGDGLYACGFIIALAWLEIKMLIQDVMSFSGFGDMFAGHLLRFIFRFALDSMMNTLQAFLWPIAVLKMGVLLLVAMYVVFPRVLKQPLERWLFDGDSGTTKAD